MWKKRGLFLFLIFQFVVNSVSSSSVISYDQRPSSFGTVGRLVKKQERVPVVSTESGGISVVEIGDGTARHSFHLQFITLDPNALFLPVLLHSEMVFYVHTGSGTLSWADADDDEMKDVELQRGDVYRLKPGSLFYLHSSLESERPRLRVIALFASDEELEEPFIGAYSSINDLIRGFDKRVLKSAFQVPEEVIEELTSATDTPAIVHETQEKKKKFWEKDVPFIETMLGIRRYNRESAENKKKHSKSKAFNIFKDKPNFHNCYGWSKVVTKHDGDTLRDSHIGVFMVNLTAGSMMGPHWNPRATEVSIVLEGEGMVRVVCPSISAGTECKNSRFRVEEGDVFTVPRFHPMAQTSFNNGTLVFMGFSTTTRKNHPQFLAGKASVLHTLDKRILGASFNVSNTTIDQILAAQKESVILECTSCAEEEEVLMEKEIEEERQEDEERRREEEERRRQEEEERRRQEDEQRKKEEEEMRRQEEEERRQREEEEERRRQEEEQKRKEEEERQRQEEEQRRHEEEKERRRHEEEQRRREEEERRREEEEERRRHEEEEERRRQEEEQRRQQEEERGREEEEQRRRQEAEQRRQEEERQREEEQQRQHDQEEKQRRQEAEDRKHEEEEQRSQEEEERRGEEEEHRRRQEEKQRRQEEERQREGEEQRRWQEEEQQRREEKEEEEEKRRVRKQQQEERKKKEWNGKDSKRKQQGGENASKLNGALFRWPQTGSKALVQANMEGEVLGPH